MVLRYPAFDVNRSTPMCVVRCLGYRVFNQCNPVPTLSLINVIQFLPSFESMELSSYLVFSPCNRVPTWSSINAIKLCLFNDLYGSEWRLFGPVLHKYYRVQVIFPCDSLNL